MTSSDQQAWLKELGKMVGVLIGADSAGVSKELGKPVGGVTKADSAGGENARGRGAQGPREKTEGQGEFIGNKGVLVFDFAPGNAALTPNQERVLMSQQVKFSTRGARLRVIGHSSADEEASVSQKRADAVATFLRADPKHAVPDENILETKGVGATRPIAPEGDKGKVNEANRKRNRSVEVVMTTAGEFLGGGAVDVDANKVGKEAPAVNEKASDAVGYADIAAAIIAGVFEETALGFAAEFVGPAAMMAHVALAQEEARASQQRIAYADGVRNCADVARDFIAKHHASVAYGDVESAAMPKIDDMTYFPADSGEAKMAASMGVKSAVDAFNPAMRRTEAFVRKRLEAKGLKDQELQKVYDKIIGDMRGNVAYALADALKAQARVIRRG
jgi:outer membrane protein OmpA-like peptidoglycan-associated protein